MSNQKTPALKTQEAFEKYFGKVTDLVRMSYPYRCQEAGCDYMLLHLDQDWIGHIRHKHNERISNREIKPKEKEDRVDEVVAAIVGGVS